MCNSFLVIALSGAASPCQMLILTVLSVETNVGFHLALSQDIVLPTQGLLSHSAWCCMSELPAQLWISLKGGTSIIWSSFPFLHEAAG